jgi:hypothetical protein
MRILPFFLREIFVRVKIYPSRIVYELPHYEGIHKMKVVEFCGTWYVIGFRTQNQQCLG